MIRSLGWTVLGLLASTVMAQTAMAQDVVRLDSVSASAGQLAIVPIRVIDRPGSPLGGDGSPSLTIRGLSVALEVSPADAVESIEIVRAGLTAGLATRFETEIPTPAGPEALGYGWIAAFSDDIPFSGGAQVIAHLRLRLAANAPPGTTIALDLDPERTALSNGAGTLVETLENGSLQLVDGTVEIGSGCTTAQELCLLGDRFLIDIAWSDFSGGSGEGHAVQLTRDAGYFWFFNEDNVEVVIKVLDGRSINGNFWVFYGALTNVEFELTVTDLVTDEVKVYENPSGEFASVGDTLAFPGDDSPALAPLRSVGKTARFLATKQSACLEDTITLCLMGGRFQLRMIWEDFQGATGFGRAVRLTGDAGYFWFFNEDNVELVVKTLDGSAINGHFWVFYGALSNVAFTLEVTDIQTGVVKNFVNPLGSFASVGDTEAF